MGDSLQDYFSNLLGCGGGGHGNITEIVSDNARIRPSLRGSNSGSSSRSGEGMTMTLDWLQDCCSADTTMTTFSSPFGGNCGNGSTPFCFSRWDSVPSSRDTAMKRPRRRPLGDGSDNPGDESVVEDYAAIYLPTEDAMDGDDRSGKIPKTLPIRPGMTATGSATSPTAAALQEPSRMSPTRWAV